MDFSPWFIIVPYGIEIDDHGNVYTTIYGIGEVHKINPR